jgi:hypothetical protein
MESVIKSKYILIIYRKENYIICFFSQNNNPMYFILLPLLNDAYVDELFLLKIITTSMEVVIFPDCDDDESIKRYFIVGMPIATLLLWQVSGRDGHRWSIANTQLGKIVLQGQSPIRF